MDAATAAGDRPRFVEGDLRFHLQIARIAGNPVMTSTMEALLGLLKPYLLRLQWTPERRALTERSHGEIYEALLAADSAAAREHVRAHLSLAYESLLARVQSVPGATAAGATTAGGDHPSADTGPPAESRFETRRWPADCGQLPVIGRTAPLLQRVAGVAGGRPKSGEQQ